MRLPGASRGFPELSPLPSGPSGRTPELAKWKFKMSGSAVERGDRRGAGQGRLRRSSVVSRIRRSLAFFKEPARRLRANPKP